MENVQELLSALPQTILYCLSSPIPDEKSPMNEAHCTLLFFTVLHGERLSSSGVIYLRDPSSSDGL